MNIIEQRRKLCKCTFYKLLEYGFRIGDIKHHAKNCPLSKCIYSHDPKGTRANKICSNCGVGLCHFCGYILDNVVLCNECYVKITNKQGKGI